MAAKKNKNSLLFLYEGETEAEFYQLIFNKHIPTRSIKEIMEILKEYIA